MSSRPEVVVSEIESPAPTLLSVLKPDTPEGVSVTLVPIPVAVVVLP